MGDKLLGKQNLFYAVGGTEHVFVLFGIHFSVSGFADFSAEWLYSLPYITLLIWCLFCRRERAVKTPLRRERGGFFKIKRAISRHERAKYIVRSGAVAPRYPSE